MSLIQKILRAKTASYVATLFATAVAGFLGAHGGNPIAFMTAILAMIGAFAIAQLLHNLDLSEWQSELGKKIDSLSAGTSGVVFSLGRGLIPSLKERLDKPKDVLLIGRTLALVLRDTELIGELLRSKVRVRLLFVNPDNGELVSQLAPTLDLKEAMPLDLATTLSIVRQLYAIPGATTHLDIRVMNFPPTMNIAVVYSRGGSDNVFAEALTYNTTPNDRLGVLCAKRDNAKWFNYFRMLAENQWKDAGPMSKQARDAHRLP